MSLCVRLCLHVFVRLNNNTNINVTNEQENRKNASQIRLLPIFGILVDFSCSHISPIYVIPNEFTLDSFRIPNYYKANINQCSASAQYTIRTHRKCSQIKRRSRWNEKTENWFFEMNCASAFITFHFFSLFFQFPSFADSLNSKENFIK